jgi:hypothetical protein
MQEPAACPRYSSTTCRPWRPFILVCLLDPLPSRRQSAPQPAACTSRPSLPRCGASGDADVRLARSYCVSCPSPHRRAGVCNISSIVGWCVLLTAAAIHSCETSPPSARWQWPWPWLHAALRKPLHPFTVCTHQPQCTAILYLFQPCIGDYCVCRLLQTFSSRAMRSLLRPIAFRTPSRLSPLNHFPDQSHTPAWRLRCVVDVVPGPSSVMQGPYRKAR